jgi:hypothetical protein
VHRSVDGLQIGWSKVQELRRYIKMFRDSGKYTICYMKVSGNWDCDCEYTPQKPLHRCCASTFSAHQAGLVSA